MSRPLRIEFPDAIYHVTSRGDRREAIYRDDDDRSAQLELLARTMDRFDAQVLAYCLMGNHYHLVLHTRQPNLSRLMRHFNGVFTQRFNRRHGLAGHLFQGRFKAILVDRDAYLLAVCRYVERNPVAAGLVRAARDWPWSSHRAHVMDAATPPWLDSHALHGYLLGHAPRTAAESRRAAARYAALVAEGSEPALWSTSLRQQVYLGDEAFVERMLALSAPAGAARATEIPKAQRQMPRTLAFHVQTHSNRATAMHAAYTQSGLTMTQIAVQAGLSVSRVSRLISGVERGQANKLAVPVKLAKGKT